jgi:hypothetical protein
VQEQDIQRYLLVFLLLNIMDFPWKTLLQTALTRARSPQRVPTPRSASPVPPSTPPPHSPSRLLSIPGSSRSSSPVPSPLASPYLPREARRRLMNDRWEPLATGLHQRQAAPSPPPLQIVRRAIAHTFMTQPPEQSPPRSVKFLWTAFRMFLTGREKVTLKLASVGFFKLCQYLLHTHVKKF